VRQRRLLQLYRPLLNITLRRAKRIIATSRPYIQSSDFLRPHANKCRVIPLSVDATRYQAADDWSRIRRRFQRSSDDCIILAVGVLRYYKGIDVLIDAMTQVDATLVIVGAGPEEQRLRTLAQAFGLARRVHFVGRVPDADLPSYYRSADVFVLPSQLRAEAFGIVQLEAMAAGLPVVSTELSTGTSVVNQHSQTGFVVAPGDPHALAQAIKVLLANSELRQYMGTMGRYRVANEYTHDLMVERTLDVYREVQDSA
jgi:rhamnosyl/mannosyltransferase